MSHEKVKPIPTNKRLKEHVPNTGVLCLTIRQEDYISIGSSIFIGLRRARGSQASIAIICPHENKIQRFEFELKSLPGECE